jgi:hypothetical protein
MTITIARRIETERAIVERLVSDALFFHGYSVSHSDGEVLTVARSRDIGPIMKQLHACDEESLIFHDADGKRVGVVSLAYRNSGYDVLADHTVNDQMTALVAGAQRLAGSLEAEAMSMSAHTPKGEHEDVPPSECATLREARKRLRTCRELWPDNEPTWCEQCREAQKRSAVMTRPGPVEDRFPRIYAMLRAAGHDPAKAAEILNDAKRKDDHARAWIGAIAASRRSVIQ